MRTLKYITPVLLLLIISCNPTEFFLNIRSELIIAGENLSTIESLEVNGDKQLILHPGAKISLRVPLVSLMTAEFTVDVQEGEGLKFYFRTVVNDFEKRGRIEFDYTTSGSKVLENGRIIGIADSVAAKQNQPKKIIIKNDGPVFYILADCDTVMSGRTKLNCTEFIIIETRPNTRAKLYGINFAETENIKKTYDVLLNTIKQDY